MPAAPPSRDTASTQAALAAALPALEAEMRRINALLSSGAREAAMAAYHALPERAVQTQRPDLTCRGMVLPGQHVGISLCRIPATPRPGKPAALFLPGLLSSLPLAAARAVALIDVADLIVCELPGHGASGVPPVVSLESFAAEYAALLDRAAAGRIAVFGESLGGLVALALGRLRPETIRSVVLIDTPFHLTRPALAAWIAAAWQAAGERPFVRRICREIMGFDPADGATLATHRLFGLLAQLPFGCAHLIGGDLTRSGTASAVTDEDLAEMRIAAPGLVLPPRVADTGHAVLLDNPTGALEALRGCLAAR
ncbi:MAG: alpha/beta fold hydrolase [Rhodospirillales bacterium]|nr:alpha/beta fold hydrolase [Rhodospirillales bacterium]